MEKEYELTVGDLHHTDKAPKCFQVPMFFDWLSKQPYYTKSTTLILTGDLVESVFETHETIAYFIDLFLNILPFGSIIIVEGNHDKNLDTNLTDVFRPIKKVKVISEDELITLGKTSFLLLPHFDHEGTDLEPMNVYYSKIHEKYPDKIDYCIHHLTDQTAPGKIKCDLSKLNVGRFRAGHIHKEDVSKGGNYLGSVTLNSISESGKTPLISLVDVYTGEEKLIEVPKFLEYAEVTYPEDLPKSPVTLYTLFTVKDSLSKKESIDFYRKQAESLGYTFYPRRIFSKKVNEALALDHKSKDKMSDKEYFTLYKGKSKLTPEVTSILEEIIA